MKDNKWHSGPPPSLGWWPASISNRNDVYRWWDGAFWSFAAVKSDSKEKAGRLSQDKRYWDDDYVEWQHRPKSWPVRSMT